MNKVALIVALSWSSGLIAHPGGHDDAYHADLPDYPTALRLPAHVTPILSDDQQASESSDSTTIEFSDFFLPPGRRGLQFTEKAKSLEGKRVRITGHMVRRCNHVPGQMMLTSRPVTLHEHEMGFADDLPMATIFVIAPTHASYVLPFARVPLEVEGRLELGSRVEPDGRVSTIRVILDGEPNSYTQEGVEHSHSSDERHDHDGHDHPH